MRVIGFEKEDDFLMAKQLEGVEIKPSFRSLRPVEPKSISFQGPRIRPKGMRAFAVSHDFNSGEAESPTKIEQPCNRSHHVQND